MNDVPGRQLVSILLIVLLTLPGSVQAQGWGGPEVAPSAPAIQGFDLLTADTGWLWLGERLYWTETGGKRWADITPLSESVIQAVAFPDTHVGWMFLLDPTAAAMEDAYTLARTDDGGQTWRLTPLVLPDCEASEWFIEHYYLYALDAQTAWLMLKQATGTNFSQGHLFKTEDGGQSWMQLAMPFGEPVYFANSQLGWTAGGPTGAQLYRTFDGGVTWSQQRIDAQTIVESQPVELTDDTGTPYFLNLLSHRVTLVAAPNDLMAGIIDLDMATSQSGWAEYQAGDCTQRETDITCVAEVRLLRTTDGAQTWDPLPMPVTFQPIRIVQSMVTQSPQGIGDQIQLFSGQGFDKCEIPTLTQLQTWMTHSPYRAVNLYFGGACRGCANPALTESFISQASQQGWKFIPTWVGPQTSAWTGSCAARISDDPAIAYNQGISEANAAIEAAANLGLTLPDKSGTIIYYDLEKTGDTTQRNAAKAFISGWVYQLHLRGNQAGVYGAACNATISDFASIANVPDAVWPAAWYWPQGQGHYDPNATVWSVPCLSDGFWSNHQRIRQYTGDITETWGGVTLPLDSDVIDGVVAAYAPDRTAPTTSISLSGIAGENGWYTSAVQVTLSASDNSGGSGLKLVQYKIGDGDWHNYTGAFNVSGEGRHTIYYQAQDNAGNWESIKTVTVKIDATAPTGSLALNNGDTVTYATLVRLTTTSTDAHSGVGDVRFRDVNGPWSDWQLYSPNLYWQLPGLTGQTLGVEVQYRDRAGNTSSVYRDTIALNLYPARPASTNYRLARSTFGASGATRTSPNYQVWSTLGQPAPIGVMQSIGYRMVSGYWARLEAAQYAIYLPLVIRQ